MNTALILRNINIELDKFTVLGNQTPVAKIPSYHHEELGNNSSTLQVIIHQIRTPKDPYIRGEFYSKCTDLHERFRTMDMNALLGIDPLNHDEAELFYRVYETVWALQLYRNKAEDTILVQFTDDALVLTFTESGLDANY